MLPTLCEHRDEEIASAQQKEHLLCARSLEQVRPISRVEELSVKERRELRVAEPRRVVLGHEIHAGLVRRFLALPVPPKPLALEPGHRKHAPVDENAQLGFVVPLGKRSGVQARPVCGVPSRGMGSDGQDKQRHG